MIAEATAATMYSNDNMGLNAKQANRQVSNYENRIANTTMSDTYRSLPNEDNECIDWHVNRVLGSAAQKNGFRGSTKLSEVEGYSIMVEEAAKDYAHGLSADAQGDIVRNANSSYYEIRNRALYNTQEMRADGAAYEPDDADLAEAAMQLELERRQLAHTTDYQNLSPKEKTARSRKASAIIKGKVDLDAEWRNMNADRIKNLEAKIEEAKQQRTALHNPKSDESKALTAKIADYNKQLKRANGGMPAAVKRRVMQNAFNNVSRSTQNDALRAGGEILKYAPPSRVASFMRHTSPSQKALQGMSPEQRRKAIQDHRMKHLDALLAMNKTAFASAVYSGAISPDDSMAWSNKHPVKSFTNDKGEVSPLMRSVNYYVRQNVIQGNPGIDPDTNKPRYNVQQATLKRNPDGSLYRTKSGHTVNAYARDSEHERKRKAANREAYARYMRGQMRKYSERSNFLDEHGKYSPEKHADALMKLTYGDDGKNGDNGYLPASAYVISHAHDVAKDDKGNTYQRIPDRTMTLFLDKVHRRREQLGESQGHSRYTDEMKRYDDMLDSVYSHVYVSSSKSAASMAAHRAAIRKQNA